jgi:hypothetical protein
VRCLKVNLERGKRIDFPRLRKRVWDTFLDTEVDAARKLNDFNPKLVEAVGIEPYCQRYASPTRTLGFPAYRYVKHAIRALTRVPCNTLESL